MTTPAARRRTRHQDARPPYVAQGKKARRMRSDLTLESLRRFWRFFRDNDLNGLGDTIA